jgi:hypothetical protein
VRACRARLVATRSAPGAGDHVGVVEFERAGREEQLDEASTLLELDDFVERGVDGVGQRLGAEDLACGLDLGESTSREVSRFVSPATGPG